MKKMITAKYVSIRQFANEISIPYTTLQSIFKRGLKAGIQNIIKKEINYNKFESYYSQSAKTCQVEN